MNEKSSNRRVSPIADLDREQIKELCDLHPLDMGQLCEKVGLNKSVLSNFLSGRRPFPQKFAPTFLRQIGLNVKGEVDPRHCFYLTVGPGLEDLAAKWIKRLFPLGGTMCVVYKNLHSDDPEEGEYRAEAGVALAGGELVAVVRDDVNFGDFAWIPGVWESGNSLNANDVLNVARLPAKKEVLAAMASVPTYDNMIWGEVQRVAEAAGLTGDEVLRIVEDAIRGFSESPQRRDAFDVEGRKAEATQIAAMRSQPEYSAFKRKSESLVADESKS